MPTNKTFEMPWSEKLPFPALRAAWIAFMLIFGSLLTGILNIPAAQSMLVVELLASAACIGTFSQLGAKNPDIKDFAAVLLFYMAVIMISAIVTCPWEILLEYYGIEITAKQQMLVDVINANWPERIFMFLAICALTPVVEEVLFRRIIFGALLNVVSPLTAILTTSMLFAIVHFFLRGLPALFIMGLGFQLIYLMRKNLFSAILLHALVNGVAFFTNILENQ